MITYVKAFIIYIYIFIYIYIYIYIYISIIVSAIKFIGNELVFPEIKNIDFPYIKIILGNMMSYIYDLPPS